VCSSDLAVFSAEQIGAADKAVALLPDERGDRLKPILADIRRDAGFRKLPSLRGIDRRLNVLRAKFANLARAIDRLGSELALASAMRPADFRVTPLLLVGEPGLGKTFFARSLAEMLDVDLDIVTAGRAQGGFVLVGGSAHWSNTQPGGVVKLLARSRSAAPVLVIDEVDKIGGDDRFPVLPVLLDLLEPGSARNFKDESLELRMDDSKVIVVLTANDIDLVPEPLLSRVEVIPVPRPDVGLRRRIVEGEWTTLRKRTRRKIDLAPGTAQALAEREDLDLRKTTRLVKDAFAQALMKKEGVAKLELPAATNKRSLGFVS
jgi:ATP-dependent Lon protease